MRNNSVKLQGVAHYHIYSRLVLGKFLLGERKVLSTQEPYFIGVSQ